MWHRGTVRPKVRENTGKGRERSLPGNLERDCRGRAVDYAERGVQLRLLLGMRSRSVADGQNHRHRVVGNTKGRKAGRGLSVSGIGAGLAGGVPVRAHRVIDFESSKPKFDGLQKVRGKQPMTRTSYVTELLNIMT